MSDCVETVEVGTQRGSTPAGSVPRIAPSAEQ